MISKEEIEELKECLKETIQNTYAEKKAIKLNNALRYIEQLETEKEKMIETLEKVLKENKAKTDCRFCNNTCDSYEACKALEKALKIMKGENDDN